MENKNKIDKLKEFAKQFSEGVVNTVVKKDDIETIAKERMDICNSCEHYNKTAGTCGICGCFMQIKARSKSASCPQKKW